MTITNGYATTAQIKNALRRPSSDGSKYDSLFEQLIEEASRYIDEYTARIFYSKTVTNELFDRYAMSASGIYISYSGDKMVFPGSIVSVSSISEDGTTLTVDDDYVIYHRQGYIYRGGWTGTRKHTANEYGIKVSATFGESTVPKDIEAICIDIVKIRSGLDTRTVVQFGETVTAEIGEQIPSHIKKALDRWRRAYV